MAVSRMATGATVTFGTSGFTALVRSLSIDGFSRQMLDESHLGQAANAYRLMRLDDLVEPPTATLEILFEPGDFPPVGASAVSETITLTIPLPAGASGTAFSIAGTGSALSFSLTGSVNEQLTGTLQIQYDGQTGPTITEESII